MSALQSILCFLGNHPEGDYDRVSRGSTTDVYCGGCGRLIGRIKDRSQDHRRRGKDAVTYGDLREMEEDLDGKHWFV